MSTTWRFAEPVKPKDFQPDTCDGCLDWMRSARIVRENNDALWLARTRTAVTAPHNHGEEA